MTRAFRPVMCAIRKLRMNSALFNSPWRLLTLCCLSSTALAAEPAGLREQLEFFESKIRPVLAQECYECHNSRDKAKSGLVLDYRDGLLEGGDNGPAIVPGKANREQQQIWMDNYHKLKNNLPEEETICFIDGAYPTHNIKPHCGWIKKGAQKGSVENCNLLSLRT